MYKKIIYTQVYNLTNFDLIISIVSENHMKSRLKFLVKQYSQNKIYKVKMLNRANCTLGRGK